ncbi:hypothetical protein E0Z10_g8837 [Xylaria hypoxylon]|uniref:Transcription factor IIIC 90kDa subunit N-terminal domain-containing protein n=1 Tax=Xylaria hypoxylon TaxID=37992 RepID=A0A4Z0Y747_9PEZI|nr:hypothetical protein E0Z10_g8837 [Xylaria hypoxylon]
MSALMSPTNALPLESIHLSILPKTAHNITWSPNNELAIGCDDCILIYVPDFSLSPSSSSSAAPVSAPVNGYDGPRQYGEAALRFPVAPLKSPELNRHLFDAVGQDFAGYSFFTGAGHGILTGHGSTLNHTVALQWSPGGLGRMGRSVLAVLTAAGIITMYGQGAPEVVASGARNEGSMRPWIPAWHVGAGLLVPAAEGHGAPDKKECITAFAWAADTCGKGAVLAYLNDDREVVLLVVHATHDAKATPGHPGKWTVLEVARFVVDGPHPILTDPTDPDYAYTSSSFALSWSPWLRRGSSLTSILSYVSHNYIGFRQITIDEPGDGPDLPSVHVGRADASGVCLHLSTDAFVVWEDKIWSMPGSSVCRGVIASPTKVQAFELPFDHISPVTKHTTDECGTTYPPQEDMIHMENPITGLIIHPPPSQTTSAPSYTLVRLSATHDNPAWHQTNLILPPNPEDAMHGNNNSSGSLRWATEISQIIEHQLPRALAHRQGNAAAKGRGEAADFDSDDEEDELDSDMDSDDDFDDEENDDAMKANFFGIRGVDTEDQVHLHRVRIWGLTASPAGGTSAVFISQHSNLEIERDTFAGLKCRVLFGAHPCTGEIEHQIEKEKTLSTEAKAWEWMYGGGPAVPGFSFPARAPRDDHAALRDQFGIIARRQLCVFCERPLLPRGTSRTATTDTSLNCANTGVPVVAPNVSRTCGVCGMKCLKSEELLRIAPQLKDIVEEDISAVFCGGATNGELLRISAPTVIPSLCELLPPPPSGPYFRSESQLMSVFGDCDSMQDVVASASADDASIGQGFIQDSEN